MVTATFIIVILTLCVAVWGTEAFGKPRFHIEKLRYYLLRRKVTEKVIWVELTKEGATPEQYWKEVNQRLALTYAEQFRLLIPKAIPSPWPILEDVYNRFPSYGWSGAFRQIGEGSIKLYTSRSTPCVPEVRCGWSKTKNLRSNMRSVKRFMKKEDRNNG